jgi:hypothetical protein
MATDVQAPRKELTKLGDRLVGTWKISGGTQGSPAVYRGAWSEDGNIIQGAWEMPGGGYEETMTRV